jgi:hypothetical protein
MREVSATDDRCTQQTIRTGKCTDFVLLHVFGSLAPLSEALKLVHATGATVATGATTAIGLSVLCRFLESPE